MTPIHGLTPGEVLANAAIQKSGSNSDLLLQVSVEGAVEGSFTPGGLHTGLKARHYTVTDVAAPIPTTPLAGRNGLSIRVLGNKTIYIGGSDVTSAQGYPKLTNEEIVVDATDNAAVEIWAVCASGESCEVAVLEIA